MIRKEVLQMLENNAKLSADKIAAKLGLSVSDVAETVAEAEAKKIVLKYKAVIDWAKLNAEKIWAFIEVKAIPHGEKGFRDIAKSIDKLNNPIPVRELAEFKITGTTGPIKYLVGVVPKYQ